MDFLDNDMEDIDDMEAVPALRKRIQKLQIKQLEQQRELDRADRMLKAQSSINRDLNTELETLKARYTADKSTLQKKVDDMEHVATKRTARIKTFEAQVKQSMRSARNDISYGLKGDDGAMATNGSQTVADSALAHPDVDFEPGENILEIYIVEATLLNGDAIPPGSIMVGGEATTLSPDSTTFVMCDFYDYETQTTPIMTGLAPQYNFAATYKIETESMFFMRYLSTETLELELNLARMADFYKIGVLFKPT